jgi:glycosyltransferase involved in cell wall biosynthesis
MKILLVQNMFYLPTYGGANKCNRILLEGLAEKKHICWAVGRSVAAQGSWSRKEFLDRLAANKINVISSSSEADIFYHKGVKVHAVINAIQLRDQLIQRTHELDPNWLIISSEDPGQSLLETALQLRPGRVIYIAHAPQLFPFGPASFSHSSVGTGLLRKVSGVVAIGSRTADYFEQYTGLKPAVIHPPVYGSGPFPNYGSFNEGFVTIVNPSAVKGISIFVELAKKFAVYDFAALLGWSTTQKDQEILAKLRNIKSYKSVEHIDEIFARTRILLVPSLYQEGFGLIVMEAMLRGIPVLASNYGGLVEAKLGVDYLLPIRPVERYENRYDDRNFPIPIIPDQDIEPWAKALRKLLSNREHYIQLSKASRKAAIKFVSNLEGMDSFEDFLQNLVPVNKSNLNRIEDNKEDQNSKMDDLLTRIDSLSPEKRALFVSRLRE